MIGHQRQNALQVILVLRCHQKPVLSDHGLCLQKQGLTADAPQQIPVGDLRVETVGIKRLAKAGVVAAHAPAGGKRRPGPERDAQVSVGVFPAVFRRRRDRSGTQPFPRLQGEKLPDPLAGEIVQDEVGLLALVQKIMADRGQIHIVEGTFPPLALAGEKGWVLQHQGAAQGAAARMKSKAPFIMTPPVLGSGVSQLCPHGDDLLKCSRPGAESFWVSSVLHKTGFMIHADRPCVVRHHVQLQLDITGILCALDACLHQSPADPQPPIRL